MYATLPHLLGFLAFPDHHTLTFSLVSGVHIHATILLMFQIARVNAAVFWLKIFSDERKPGELEFG